jgi:hypothetical protein
MVLPLNREAVAPFLTRDLCTTNTAQGHLTSLTGVMSHLWDLWLCHMEGRKDIFPEEGWDIRRKGKTILDMPKFEISSSKVY